jgi:hypothetical protein
VSDEADPENPFELDGLVVRARAPVRANGRAPPKPARISAPPGRRLGRFVPMPMEWFFKLTKTTALVALFLQHRAFEEHNQVVKLPNRQLASQGVGRQQKLRALAELETLGLISVERRKRKSPVITLL